MLSQEPSAQQQREVSIPAGIRILERNWHLIRDSILGLGVPNQGVCSVLVTFCRETNLVAQMNRMGMGMMTAQQDKKKVGRKTRRNSCDSPTSWTGREGFLEEVRLSFAGAGVVGAERESYLLSQTKLLPQQEDRPYRNHRGLGG